MCNDLPPVEHLDFPLVFSLDGDRGKGTGKVRYDSVCVLYTIFIFMTYAFSQIFNLVRSLYYLAL